MWMGPWVPSPWAPLPDRAVAVRVVASRVAFTPARLPRRRELVVVGGLAAAPGPSLNLQGVTLTIPADGMVLKEGVTYFTVVVQPPNEFAPWCVQRRYNDFRCLAELVRRCDGRKGLEVDGATFPSKTFGRCTGSALDERRVALEAWLRAVLCEAQTASAAVRAEGADLAGRVVKEHSTGRLSVIQLVSRPNFYAARSLSDDTEHTMPASLCEVAGVPWEFSFKDGFLMSGRGPVLPSPSAPVPRTDSEMDLAGLQPLQLLEVIVPEGVGAGERMEVSLPDGASLFVVVPTGLVPGSPLRLWYDADAGTLGVHASQDWQALRQ